MGHLYIVLANEILCGNPKAVCLHLSDNNDLTSLIIICLVIVTFLLIISSEYRTWKNGPQEAAGWPFIMISDHASSRRGSMIRYQVGDTPRIMTIREEARPVALWSFREARGPAAWRHGGCVMKRRDEINLSCSREQEHRAISPELSHHQGLAMRGRCRGRLHGSFIQTRHAHSRLSEGKVQLQANKCQLCM